MKISSRLMEGWVAVQAINDEVAKISEYCLGRKEYSTNDMVKQFAAKISHPYKKLVYSIACPEGTYHKGTLNVSRYKSIPPPSEFPPENFKTEFEMKEDIYEYEPNNDPNTVEWYVNFADPSLFVAYGGSLFAQDEMQVAEMPSLGHLKEALKSESNSESMKGLEPYTRRNGKPTPILIRGIERRVKVFTDKNAKEGRPRGLYGNTFSSSSPEAVKNATKRIEPPTIVNMIAMAALDGGHGRYSLEQIEDLYSTAYTSFVAAKYESRLLVNDEKFGSKKPKVVVHTGNWGTGAFGGNKPLMAIIQLAAAWHAKIDKLVYHTFNQDGTDGYKAGLSVLEYDFQNQKSIETKEFLKSLQNKGFRWGYSDGN